MDEFSYANKMERSKIYRNIPIIEKHSIFELLLKFLKNIFYIGYITIWNVIKIWNKICNEKYIRFFRFDIFF